MSRVPRVALLADSVAETNGAARTCRELIAFAGRRDLPLLTLTYGKEYSVSNGGSIFEITVPRSRLSFLVDPDLYFDLLFYRHARWVRERLQKFRPDVVHVIGPGSAGLLGLIVTHQLRLPLVASWHTNLHEFAARRVEQRLSPLARRLALGAGVEQLVLKGALWFYGHGAVLLAPNAELVELLRASTGRPTLRMPRGIDIDTFNPGHRNRTSTRTVRIGYVGRLKPEKNVRFLAALESRLAADSDVEFQLMIIGDGEERNWLQSHLSRAVFTGVLKGKELSEAYANLDIFAFPSKADTFGNVVQEAAASGVPSVVMRHGGPKFIVQQGVTGYVAVDDDDFICRVWQLLEDPDLRRTMGAQAREASLENSWDQVFEGVYQGYELAARAMTSPRPDWNAGCA